MNRKYLLNELTMEVTRQCPMRCLVCSSNGGDPDPNELDLKDLKKIVDEAIKLGLKVISLSGGEPLVWSYLNEFIEYVKSKEIGICLYTCGNIEKANGIGPIDDDTLLFLKDQSVDKLIYSIHGPNQETHDTITTKTGSFENLITSIKKSREIGIPVELHFVPVALNYKLLPEIVELAEKLQVDKLSLLRFVPQGRGAENRKLLEINGNDINNLRCIIDDLYNTSSIGVRVGSPFNCFQIGCSSSCTAGIDKATMRPDGLVFPCVSMKNISINENGNDIRKKSLISIWNKSDVFEQVRNIIRFIEQSDCAKCSNFSSCHGGCITQRLINNPNMSEGKDPYCALEIRKSHNIAKKERLLRHKDVNFWENHGC